MFGARRHRFVAGAVVVLLSGLAAGPGHAQDGRLLANCAAPQPAPPAATPPAGSTDPPPSASAAPAATVSCELRATDAVVFKGVKATIKGRSEPLQVEYTGFDVGNKSLVALFLVQTKNAARRGNLAQMTDAIVKIADSRDGKRRFAVYSFANDLNLVAAFDASKRDFDRQVRAIKASTLPSELYKTTLDAISKLAKEQGDRKALIILGDGASDEPADEHDYVLKAAKDAGVVIHALGYVGEAADSPNFQSLRRLADDTGGFRKEVRIGGAQKYTITPQFVSEVLENGGSARITLKEPPGRIAITITADFASGRSESVEHSLTLAAPPSSPRPNAREQPSSQAPQTQTPFSEPEAWHQRPLRWALEHVVLASVIGVALLIGIAGLTVLAISSFAGREPEAPPAANQGPVYGWLDMLDGNASRYPLQTTNVRIGRHRDNDICLQNDSISRRHALLHFNADDRRFVITDLGGDNGVIVNKIKIKQQSHEVNDGDLVELGEVRLRFRTNTELVG
jgi:hypothetical protein